ncbi:hypothetical protein L210DRAFT_3536215 [Boletus edulis BED1]|uniref:Uncharacterized protein n=1 Tax=Boletus edulis BED1 TaxID=1328754 RepID=A0AAD4BXF1_BOLED|nr:hypothetical protein L210DRAFT_3536215 [Boletus edulis BED1]
MSLLVKQGIFLLPRVRPRLSLSLPYPPLSPKLANRPNIRADMSPLHLSVQPYQCIECLGRVSDHRNLAKRARVYSDRPIHHEHTRLYAHDVQGRCRSGIDSGFGLSCSHGADRAEVMISSVERNERLDATPMDVETNNYILA